MADITLSVDTSGLVDGQNIDANDPLVAINNLKTHLENFLNGVQVVGRLNFETTEALTLTVGGAISPTKTNVKVDTFGAASAQDLNTINNGVEGRTLLLRITNNAHVVTVKTGTGNIVTATGRDYVLTSTDVMVLLVHNGANWLAFLMDNATFLNVGTDTTLTIATGAVTKTRARHLLAGEGGAADELDTINGGSEGDLVFAQIADASDPITFKHNTGNLYLPYGEDLVFDDLRQMALLLHDGSKYVMPASVIGLRAPIASTVQGAQILRLPERSVIDESIAGQKRLALLPDVQASHTFQAYASAATIQSNGIAPVTIANTPVVANDADGAAVRLPTTAAAGNLAGFISTTFNLTQRQYNPRFVWRMKTYNDLTSQRLWLGLTSAAMTNSDTAPAAFAGFRYSSAAPDTNWQLVTRDGTTQHVTDTGILVATDTLYVFELWMDDATGTVYARINGTLFSKTDNPPVTAQDLGFCTRVIAVAAAIRNIIFYRMGGEWK